LTHLLYLMISFNRKMPIIIIHTTQVSCLTLPSVENCLFCRCQIALISPTNRIGQDREKIHAFGPDVHHDVWTRNQPGFCQIQSRSHEYRHPAEIPSPCSRLSSSSHEGKTAIACAALDAGTGKFSRTVCYHRFSWVHKIQLFASILWHSATCGNRLCSFSAVSSDARRSISQKQNSFTNIS
jgi:hypothetical protein